MILSKPSRVQAADDIRVMMMMLGVIFHSAQCVTSSGDWTSPSADIWLWISGLIHVFRMQAFFMLSGYLSINAMNRPGYLVKRARQFLIPAFFAWIILFHISNSNWTWRNFKGDVDFSSLWFLITLFYMTIFTWLLNKYGILEIMTKYLRVYPVWYLGVAFILQMGIMLFDTHVLVRYHWASHFGIANTLYRAVDFELYFLTGLMIAKIPQWQDALKYPIWRYVGLSAFIFWAVMTRVDPPMMRHISIWTIVCILMCGGIISWATQTKMDLRWTKPFVPACFTVYLWHFPLIEYFSHHLIITDASSKTSQFLFLVSMSFGISLIAYAFIQQSSILRWMWLGEEFPYPLPTLPMWTNIKVFLGISDMNARNRSL